MPTDEGSAHVALIGLGTIGISFAALYLKYLPCSISVYDPRPDLEEHVRSILPGYLDAEEGIEQLDKHLESGRIKICSALKEACENATIVQEQTSENLELKKSIWKDVVDIVGLNTHLWSSTSGIPASKQAEDLDDKTRLLVIHPFNPPHLMPLIEIVPSPLTSESRVRFAKSFFELSKSGHQPVVIKKEVPGFVGNRLAFVLLREACHLVSEGVVSIEDLDKVVEASIGPRWAVTGPFKSYHYGGGTKGLGAFFQNLSGTIESIWGSSGTESFEGTSYLKHPASEPQETASSKSWADDIVDQTAKTYGMPTPADFAKRDEALKKVLAAKGLQTG